MSTLAGKFISQSYGGVIHLNTNQGIVPGTPTLLEDGLGQSLGISVAGNGQMSVTGITGSLHGSASYALTASYALNGGGGSSISASYAFTASYAENIVSFPTTSYTQQILVASTTWSIQHGLNTASPIISVWNGNNMVLPENIVRVDNNNIRALFSVPITGYITVAKGGAPFTASYVDASKVFTSSFNSYTASVTSNFAGSASYAFTASYALNGGGGAILPPTYSQAFTASFVSGAIRNFPDTDGTTAVVNTIATMTSASYQALATKNANTLYVII